MRINIVYIEKKAQLLDADETSNQDFLSLTDF